MCLGPFQIPMIEHLMFFMKEQNFNEQEHGFRSKFKNKLKTDESLYIASEQRD